MNKLYTVLILIFLSSCFLNKAIAGHIDGADISYSCTTTPGIFEVTFNYGTYIGL